MRALFFLSLFFLFAPVSYAVYTDEIALDSKRVWEAAHQALESYGIGKENPAKGTLESRWIEDLVRRSHKFLPEAIKGSYLRRYRLVITLREEGGKTSVTIKGKFQQKDTGLPPAAPWLPISPKTEDYEMERNFFMKLIARLEQNLTSPS